MALEWGSSSVCLVWGRFDSHFYMKHADESGAGDVGVQ